MASTDWNTVFSGTSYYMIQAGSPPVGTQWCRIYLFGTRPAAFFYKWKTDFANCQMNFYAAPQAISMSCEGGIRFNRLTGNGYALRVTQTNGTIKGIYLHYLVGWVAGSILASAALASVTGAWTRIRVRCWDMYVPAWRLRFTCDYYSGGSWVNLLTYDDTSPSAVNGELGFGNLSQTNTGNIDFDYVELFTETP